MIDLRLGDCLEVMRDLEDSSIDAIVTDPPYGLSFMGKKWDYDVPSVEVWAECLRVLKPGGHLLAFAGTRTQHRMAVRIEDAGFEIRDMIAWVYGSGFPKSLDVSKAIDRAAGALGTQASGFNAAGGKENYGKQDKSFRADYGYQFTATTPEAQQWAGWGTALKPALEPVTVARKPLGGRTVAANVLEHGTGALNIDGCRVGIAPQDLAEMQGRSGASTPNKVWGAGVGNSQGWEPTASGRWPANLIHDGSDEVVALFPQTTSGALNQASVKAENTIYGKHDGYANPKQYAPDTGSAARFFYCAKASKKERGEGNTHPTVKPTDLMRYLCRLVTPPGGIVLDPFMGSGSTGKASLLEGFRFIGIERDPAYLEIARARIVADAKQLPLLVA